jgi:hypothetical protein
LACQLTHSAQPVFSPESLKEVSEEGASDLMKNRLGDFREFRSYIQRCFEGKRKE